MRRRGRERLVEGHMITETISAHTGILDNTCLPDRTYLQGNRYVICRTLGKGGFGITYQALDTGLRRTVAIKEFFPGGNAYRNVNASLDVQCAPDTAQTFEHGKNRFLKEAQTLAKLDYLHIVKVYDCFQENNTAYIVMEYIEGKTLAQAVKISGTLTKGQLLELFLPLMHDLDAIHKKGLLHRDISPDNIMVTAESRQLKLIDFGTAKDLSPSDEKSCSFSESKYIVKMNYSPIEMFSDAKKHPSADVYSLCATMYFCLTGKVPPSSLERAFDDTHKLSFSPGIDGTVKQAVLKGMSLKPEERHASMDALQKALTGGKSANQKTGWLILGSIIVLALALFACVGIWFSTHKDVPSQYPDAETVQAKPSPTKTATTETVPAETSPAESVSVIDRLKEALLENYPAVSVKGTPEDLENITIYLGMTVDETLPEASLTAAEQVYQVMIELALRGATVHLIDEKEDELCRVNFWPTEEGASIPGLGGFSFAGGRLREYEEKFQALYEGNAFIHGLPKARSEFTPPASNPIDRTFTLTTDEAGYQVMQGTTYQIYCPFPAEFVVDTEAVGETLLLRANSTVNRNFIEIHGQALDQPITAEAALMEAESALGGRANYESYGSGWFACSMEEGAVGVYRKGKLRAGGTVLVWFDYHAVDSDQQHSEYIEYMEDYFTSNME